MSDRPKHPDVLDRIETHSSLYDKLTHSDALGPGTEEFTLGTAK